MSNPRITIAHIIHSVAYEHINLDDAFARHLKQVSHEQHSFIKAASFGTCRYFHRLKFILGKFMSKPIKQKEALVECLLLSGLHECLYMQTPSHACVSENVEALMSLKKVWAKGLCNAILRKTLREPETIDKLINSNDVARYSHPQWFIDKLAKHPDKQHILDANNQAGPFTLRVNQQKISRAEYIQQLSDSKITANATRYSPAGIVCAQASDVTALPGFRDGWISVQDEAAQLAAVLLNAKPGERILDACAAPGGKTAHILETTSDIDLLAIDHAESRLHYIHDNLQRLGLFATVKQGDAAQPDDWWDQQPFDRILLDAPCSATGVIRRHPDIKLLRRADDIPQLAKTQAQMLRALWPLLKTGGMLLYATCSVLPEENEMQIQKFIAATPGARHEPINADWGHACNYGRQIWPGDEQMDGFFYAAIYKDS